MPIDSTGSLTDTEGTPTSGALGSVSLPYGPLALGWWPGFNWLWNPWNYNFGGLGATDSLTTPVSTDGLSPAEIAQVYLTQVTERFQQQAQSMADRYVTIGEGLISGDTRPPIAEFFIEIGGVYQDTADAYGQLLLDIAALPLDTYGTDDWQNLIDDIRGQLFPPQVFGSGVNGWPFLGSVSPLGDLLGGGGSSGEPPAPFPTLVDSWPIGGEPPPTEPITPPVNGVSGLLSSITVSGHESWLGQALAGIPVNYRVSADDAGAAPGLSETFAATGFISSPVLNDWLTPLLSIDNSSSLSLIGPSAQNGASATLATPFAQGSQ